VPIIVVNMFPGRTREQKKDFVESVTREAARSLGCPADAVKIVIQEQPTENWGFGGVQGCELYPGK